MFYVDDRRELKKQIEKGRTDRLKESLRTNYREKDKDWKRSMRTDRGKWTDNMSEEAEAVLNRPDPENPVNITQDDI